MDKILQAIKDFINTLIMAIEIENTFNSFPGFRELTYIAGAIGIYKLLKKLSKRKWH